MLYPATEKIYQRFQDKNYKCEIIENDEDSRVRIGMETDVTSFHCQYITRKEEDSFNLRIYRLIKIPQNASLTKITRAVNECNMKYRFMKFVLDNHDYSVDVYYDTVGGCDDIGELAIEMLYRASNIIDLCYPILMKSIYA